MAALGAAPQERLVADMRAGQDEPAGGYPGARSIGAVRPNRALTFL